jgi:hypothetical protein
VTSAEDTIPSWGALPNAAVALVLIGVGSSNMTTGGGSVVCVAAGVLYAADVGLFLRRPPRKRNRRWTSFLLRRLVRALLRPLIVPPVRAVLWAASHGYLFEFKRDHRWLMQPEERPILTLREDADDGDVWVLSDQAVYIGLKTADRRLSRTRRADLVNVSEAEMGDLIVVTLAIEEEEKPARVVTGCFRAVVHQRQVRRLIRELSPSGR